MCVVPTWRGWLAFFLAVALIGAVVLLGVHPFLSVNDPVPADLLVLEGWASDHATRAAIQEFHRGGYRLLAVTGGPIEDGAPLFAYHSYAERGTAIIAKFDPQLKAVQAVPAPLVRKDRTYTSAVALRDWLRQNGGIPPALNVVSQGPHARRTRLLYEKAFGGESRIGIIAHQSVGYDPARWWRSSQGFRTVTDEAVAYLYARMLFRAE